MAIYTNLPLYKAAYTLMLDVSRMMPNLPRDCRYSLGQDLRNKIMEIIICVYKANRVKIKHDIISKMQEAIVEAQVYIRVMCDLKYISERKYVVLSDQTVEISKQISAWAKSEKRLENGEHRNISQGQNAKG